MRLTLGLCVLLLAGCNGLALKNPPFIDAVTKGDKKLVERMLAEGADPNQKNERGDTALYYAGVTRRWDIAELLVRHGIDVNSRDNQGQTLLDLWRERKHQKGIDWLVKHGAK